jgi:hypothetical protein
MTEHLTRSDFLEGYGRDGEEAGIYFMDFASAVSTWAACQMRERVSIAEAEMAFNVSPDIIREAAHTGIHLMFVTGNPKDPREEFIEHDGE